MPALIDPRQAVLARLRTLDLTKANDPSLVSSDYLKGYTRAVIAVCRALEETAAPDELWESGIPAADLKPTDNLGEHLAATRRYFGMIP